MVYKKIEKQTQKPLQFTHLHVHTQYSLLDGASKPKELLQRAMELGMDSIAITDHGNMYGAVDIFQTADKLNKEAEKEGKKPIKIIFGCECYLTPGNRLEHSDKNPRYHLILLAENEEGYHNLIKLVSLGFIEGFYRKPRIDKEILRKYSKGLICLSACVQGEIPRLILENKLDEAENAVKEYMDIFGKENFFLEIQNHDLPEEKTANLHLRTFAKKYGIGLVATNDVHYVRKEDANAQDVLLAIQTGKTVDDPERLKFNNNWYYLKSAEEMQALFPGEKEALENTHKIAERCNVSMTFGKLLLPEFPIPKQYADADAYVKALCVKELNPRYGAMIMALPPEKREAKKNEVLNRLKYELEVIKKMGYAAYFLIVWDFINYCRNHKDKNGNPDPIPVGPGRGSAAGSIVAYLMHITNIEPLQFGLLFERFLNPERVSMPDIDTDFCYRRRGEVLDYVIRKYGADHVSLIITFGTLQARAAVRDVARALGVPLPKADKIAKSIPKELGVTLDKALENNKELKTMYDTDPETRKIINIAKSVEGLPRNSGTHAAGVVIAPKPLIELVPLRLDEAKDENSEIGQDRMITTQFDKVQVEDLGLLKMDFLGLRTLTVISDAIHFIKQNTGKTVDIDNIPLKDELTSKMLCDGKTQGVFQLESGGMTRLVQQLAPENMPDLVPLVALYRPGPLDAGMADLFIEGRRLGKAVTSIHPLLDDILADTYGVVLYQEQVMQTASILAGFSMGEADLLRRAMGKKKLKDLAAMRDRFVQGAKKLHKVPEAKSNEIFDILLKFAGYGFNKSHSVAYALIAWQTAYLKAHWPAEYFAAFLTSIMHDNDKLSHYISVCKDEGIEVLPPDVNASMEGFSVEKGKIRFGMVGIKTVGRNAVAEIIRARNENGHYKDIFDFCKRISYRSINKRMIENLIKCGAMDSFKVNRSQMLAIYDAAVKIGVKHQKDNESGLVDLFGEFNEYTPAMLPEIPEIPKEEKLQHEKELTGFYITGHPLDDYRYNCKILTHLSTIKENTEELDDGANIKVGGIVNKMEIKVTKKGDTMAILQLEDFTGHSEIVVFPQAYEQFCHLLMEGAILRIEGRFSADDRGNKIIASRIFPLRKDKKFKTNYIKKSTYTRKN